MSSTPCSLRCAGCQSCWADELEAELGPPPPPPPMLPACPFCQEPLAAIAGAPCAGCARTLDRLEVSRVDRRTRRLQAELEVADRGPPPPPTCAPYGARARWA